MLHKSGGSVGVRRWILLVLTIFILLGGMYVCMHTFQLSDFVRPVYAQAPEYDYVDQLSNVDGITDVGTHSSFDNEKAFDSTYDTLTEENVPVISNNLEDYVDISTSNVDEHDGHGTHSDFTKQQAADSQYDTLTEANTNPNIVWTEAFTSFTPAGTGWQNYDIYTNKGVPKGAIAEIIIASVNDAANRIVGVRTDGSSLSRYINLHESEAGGATTVNMLVKVHETTGLIETYCDSTTGITYYLTGYWTGVDFIEMATTFQPTQTATWHDKNLYLDYSVPKGSVIQIHCHHNTGTAYKLIGVRTDGSSLVRSLNVHEAEGTVTATSGYDTYVKSSVADGIIDIYGQDTTTVYFLLLGYFESAMDYIELWTQKAIGAGAWTDVDLTADLDQDNRVTNFVLTHGSTATEQYLGARQDGSSLIRYILEHESEGTTTDRTGFGIIVNTDPNTGIVELWTGTTSEYFYLAGYFKWAMPNYELDLEGQWASADFDETSEYLCIKTGTLNGETLGVDVWHSDHWDNVIASLTASAWNNVSVTTWLTGATFTMRFLGGTESGDTTLSTWEIDCVLLHTYTSTDNYRLDLEEQFTDAEYTRTYEELCIYTGTTDAEDIKVYVWITSNSSWVLLFSDLTANSWNNISVTSYLIDSTFTIKFVDGTQSSDSSPGTWQKDCALLHTWSIGYDLNLRVLDWDLTDSISGALVYKDTDVLTSDSGGWANWTLVTGTVAVKVKYFGFWVNGTFQVEMTEDKTIDVKCNLYDVTITVQENIQSAYLVNANVSVYNASSTYENRIKTGITGDNGQVSLTNLPNNTLTFTQYGKSDWSLVIGNTTQLVDTENQSITLTSNQNNLSIQDSRGLIGIVAGFVIPIPLKGYSIKKYLKRKKVKRGENIGKNKSKKEENKHW